MRCFIAIEIPEKVRAALAELQEELKDCGADVRWVKPENIHLTLKFLGNIEESAVKGIVERTTDACSQYNAFNLEAKGMGIFPNTRSPRVLWVDVKGNSIITALQREVEAGMVSIGFKPEDRKFAPHLTLGRFRSSVGKDKLYNIVELYKTKSYGVIDVNSVSLMRSDLNPAGARYTKIAEIPFGRHK